MSAADDRLTAILARAEAATPAPWKLWGMSVLADPVGNSNLDDGIPVADTLMRNAEGKPRTFDAQFIASSRQDVPDLVTGHRAVLRLHRAQDPPFNWCSADGDDYPCPTVRAIESALGGGAA